MAGFLAGDILTAARINRLQPAVYWAQATSTVAASSTNTDLPSATVTFTTETNGATVVIDWQVAFYANGGVPGGLSSSRALIDGTTGSPTFAIAHMAASTDKVQGAACWKTTIATAGSHTIKLQATTNTNTVTQVYSQIKVTVIEVV